MTDKTTYWHKGFEAGARIERERIAKICQEIAVSFHSDSRDNIGEGVFISDLMSYLNDKDNA